MGKRKKNKPRPKEEEIIPGLSSFLERLNSNTLKAEDGEFIRKMIEFIQFVEKRGRAENITLEDLEMMVKES